MVPELWHCLETPACDTRGTAHVGMGGWGSKWGIGGMNLGGIPLDHQRTWQRHCNYASLNWGVGPMHWGTSEKTKPVFSA